MVTEEHLKELSYTDAPKIVTSKIPGPKTEALLEQELANETPTRIAPIGIPLAWEEAFGATFKDPDGNVYIDLSSGVAVNNVGHSHPDIVKVVQEECSKLMHTPDGTCKNRQRLGQMLSDIAPGNLKNNVKMAYGLSGSSANEIAIKYARASTGKSIILAFQGAYHGSIGTTLTLTTSPTFRSKYRPFMPFVERLGPYPYCYRCPYELTHPKCELKCAKYVEFQLTDPYGGIDVNNVAALILEPMQGEGGYVPPPEGWMEHIYGVCKRLGILVIDDEVQMGMGRTGTMFAIENFDVEPDIITMGKALGGDLPFSAVLCRSDLVQDLEPFSHVLTAVGNSTSCAVACKNIELVQNGLCERAKEMGRYAMERLKELAKKREIIGDVRGMGWGIALELVSDKKSKTPLSTAEVVRLVWLLRDNGVYVLPCGRYGNILRVIPPLVITKEMVDKALGIIADVTATIDMAKYSLSWSVNS
jgi:4-aminobutyrate aminotransferase